VPASSTPALREIADRRSSEPARPVSQNSTAYETSVDVVLGEPSSPTAEAIKGLGAYRHEMPVSLERR